MSASDTISLDSPLFANVSKMGRVVWIGLHPQVDSEDELANFGDEAGLSAECASAIASSPSQESVIRGVINTQRISEFKDSRDAEHGEESIQHFELARCFIAVAVQKILYRFLHRSHDGLG